MESDCFFFAEQETAYEVSACLVGSERGIRDSVSAMLGLEHVFGSISAGL